MIRLHHVHKSFGTGENRIEVLRDVSLEIGQGDFVAIMGPSGSGKSTLMHILGCLDVPTSGTYTLDGTDTAELSANELARIRNQKIGFVFQNFFLLSRMTAHKNVELPLVYAGVNQQDRQSRANQLLDQVGLRDRAGHLPHALSGGQKQRVAIARALANEPAILLADEPTGALDQATGAEIMRLFQALNRSGATIVLITHDPQVASYANWTIHLRDGRIVRMEGGPAS